MKKYIFPLLFVGLLCGCSQKPISSSEEMKESTTASEIQTEPETPAIMTEKVPEPTTEPSSVGRLTYTVSENGISLKMDGKAIQNIELGYSPMNSFISAADFDFDGYEDIFIPFEDPHRDGCYYRYNPDTEQFESWDKLNEIGYVMEIGEGDTLLMKMDSMEGSKCITYQWKNGEITPVLLCYQYFTSEGPVNDLYEYAPDGSMILFERQFLEGEKMTIGRDELIYFFVKENGIDVLRNGEVLQTIQGDYFGELDLAARKVRYELPIDPPQYDDEYGFYVPEDYLNTTDFDFDGFDDLFIPTDHLSSAGVYYRFDPETELFEEWDALNQIGKLMYTEKENEALISSHYDIDKKESEKCIYQWENDRLVRVSRELSYYGTDGERYTDYFDSADQLIRSEQFTTKRD